METYLVGFKHLKTFVEACYYALERCKETTEEEIFTIVDGKPYCLSAIVRGTTIYARSRSSLALWDDEQRRVRIAERESLIEELEARVKKQEQEQS